MYRILQEEGIDLPRYAVLNRDPDKPDRKFLIDNDVNFYLPTTFTSLTVYFLKIFPHSVYSTFFCHDFISACG